MMSAMRKAQEAANEQRKEAKRMLYSAIGLPENTGSNAIDRAVDCIISAAVLEAVMIVKQGMQEREENRTRRERG